MSRSSASVGSRVARRGGREQRAGLRIELAEAQEVARPAPPAGWRDCPARSRARGRRSAPRARRRGSPAAPEPAGRWRVVSTQRCDAHSDPSSRIAAPSIPGRSVRRGPDPRLTTILRHAPYENTVETCRRIAFANGIDEPARAGRGGSAIPRSAVAALACCHHDRVCVSVAREQLERTALLPDNRATDPTSRFRAGVGRFN